MAGVLTHLCEFAADSTLGLDGALGGQLLVFVGSQAASAAELLERLAGVHLGHNGALHTRYVPADQRKCRLRIR